MNEVEPILVIFEDRKEKEQVLMMMMHICIYAYMVLVFLLAYSIHKFWAFILGRKLDLSYFVKSHS